MDSGKLNDWLQTLASVGVILSLVFVGLEIQQSREIAIVDTHGALSEESAELSILIGENMDVWSKGLEGETLSADEQGLFMGLLAAVEMHHQRRFIRWRGIGPGDPDVHARRFAFALYIFPGMRASYEADIDFVTAMDNATGQDMAIRPWKRAVLKSLAELDAEKPPIQKNMSYIFWAM